jgi:hypothetical protein
MEIIEAGGVGVRVSDYSQYGEASAGLAGMGGRKSSDLPGNFGILRWTVDRRNSSIDH